MGISRTKERILRRYYWPGIFSDVAEYCRTCEVCQRSNTKCPPRAKMIPMPVIEVPFQRIAMDIVGPLPRTQRGNRFILTICVINIMEMLNCCFPWLFHCVPRGQQVHRWWSAQFVSNEFQPKLCSTKAKNKWEWPQKNKNRLTVFTSINYSFREFLNSNAKPIVSNEMKASSTASDCKLDVL